MYEKDLNKEKQIEEMAKAILKCSCVGTCLDCEYATLSEDYCACIDVKIAEGLYNAGYRKASDVAEDIIRILRAAGINEHRYPVVAELKKKYTEDGE